MVNNYSQANEKKSQVGGAGWKHKVENEKEPHWVSNKRLFLFNQFVPNGVLMFPDFHPKMWFLNWLKLVKGQLRVEFPCTSTTIPWLLVYMLLLWTKILRKKHMQIWSYLCTPTSIFFRNRKGDIPFIVLAVQGPHTVVLDNLRCFWCTLTAACLHCEGGKRGNLLIHKNDKSLFPRCYPSVLTTGAVKWLLTDGDPDDKSWVCLWLWWIQINIHSFSITVCKALRRGVRGGGNTGSLSWLLSGVGWDYALDETPVCHMTTQLRQTTLTPKNNSGFLLRLMSWDYGRKPESALLKYLEKKPTQNTKKSPHRKAPS